MVTDDFHITQIVLLSHSVGESFVNQFFILPVTDHRRNVNGTIPSYRCLRERTNEKKSPLG